MTDPEAIPSSSSTVQANEIEQTRRSIDMEFQNHRQAVELKLKEGNDRMDGLDLKIDQQGVMLQANTLVTQQIADILQGAEGFFTGAARFMKFLRWCAWIATPFVTLWLTLKYGKPPEH